MRVITSKLVLLVIFVCVVYAAPSPGVKVVGGEDATIEQYPYMVSVNIMDASHSLMLFCGGSLITSSTILSAAHCYMLDWYPVSSYRFRVGSSFASSGGVVIEPADIINHPNYNDQTKENDVSIVRLRTPAQFSSTVGIARIAGPNYHLPDNTPLTNMGWGVLYNNGPAPEQLQHVEVNIINQELCAERYKTIPWYNAIITDDMMCSGILDVGGKDACSGDSGGPVIHNSDIIYGVVSWGYTCAHAVYPGVNARVSYFANWIVENGSA